MVTNLRRLSQGEHELALARRRVDIGAPVMTLKPTRSMNAACRRRYGLDARLRSTMQSGERQSRTALLLQKETITPEDYPPLQGKKPSKELLAAVR